MVRSILQSSAARWAAATVLGASLAATGVAAWNASTETVDSNSAPVASATPRVARSASGWSVAGWVGSAGGTAHAYACRHDGTAWEPAVQLDGTTGHEADGVRVAVGEDGTATVVWVALNPATSDHVWASVRGPSGWTPQALDGLDDLTTSGGVTVGAGPGGNCVVGWAETAPWGTEYRLRMRSGGTWQDAVSINSGDVFGAQDIAGCVGMDASGTAFAVWSQDDGTNYRMYASRWDGSTWSNPVSIDSNPTFESWDPSIAMDGAGNAAVTWIHNPGGSWRQRAAFWHDGAWTTATEVDFASGVDYGDAESPRIALAPGGRAVAVCSKTVFSGGLRASINRATNWTWGTPAEPEPGTATSDPVPAIDADGVAHVAYLGAAGSRLVWFTAAGMQGPVDVLPTAPGSADSAWIASRGAGSAVCVFRDGANVGGRFFVPESTGTPPKFRSLRPASGASGARVQLVGSGFGKTAGTVTFGGVPANVVRWRTNGVTVDAPEGIGTVDVRVTTSDGGTATRPFTYKAPVLKRISPARTFAGRKVLLKGANFGKATEGGACAVDFGGTHLVPGDAGIVKWSNGSIKVVVPEGTGTVEVTVTTSAGTTAVRTFTYR